MALAKSSKIKLASTLCLVALLLSGCSAPTVPVEETMGTSLELDENDVEKALKEFVKDDPKANVINDSQLRKSIPAAQEWIENIKVQPSKCGVVFAAPVAEQLKNAKMAAAQLADEYLTIALYPDSQTLKTQWDSEVSASAECARYSVTKDGKTLAYHLAEQRIATEAPLKDAYVITSSDGSTTRQQLVVRAAKGNLMIGFQQVTSAKLTAEQLEQIAEQIDSLFAQFAK